MSETLIWLQHFIDISNVCKRHQSSIFSILTVLLSIKITIWINKDKDSVYIHQIICSVN